MTKRAEESGQDYIYATTSWGNLNKLNEIPASKLNLTEQKNGNIANTLLLQFLVLVFSQRRSCQTISRKMVF